MAEACPVAALASMAPANRCVLASAPVGEMRSCRGRSCYERVAAEHRAGLVAGRPSNPAPPGASRLVV